MTKYLNIINLIFIVTALMSTGAECQATYLEKHFKKSSIQQTTIQYATVDYSNPIEIWEQELGIGKVLSLLIDYSLPKKLKMDVYEPSDDKIRPALIIIHGGAFLPMMGSKKDASMKLMGNEFAQRGYRVFSIEYRPMNILAPSFIKGGYTATQDAKAALRYIANHAEMLSINPNQMFIGGISAGAVTSLHATFLDQDEPIAGRAAKLDRMYGCLDCVGEKQERPYQIRGVINIAGGVYNPSILNKNTPVISFHGAKDNMVPIDCNIPFERVSKRYNQFLDYCIKLVRNNPKIVAELREGKVTSMCGSKEIHEYLKANGQPSYFLEVPEGTHYLVLSENDVFTKRGRQIMKSIARFMHYQLSGRLKTEMGTTLEKNIK